MIFDKWDDMYEEYLGIRPTDSSSEYYKIFIGRWGRLDISQHILLGICILLNYYLHTREDLPEHDAQISSGDFSPLLDWMRKKVHRRGSILKPAELIEEATGSPPRQRHLLIISVTR